MFTLIVRICIWEQTESAQARPAPHQFFSQKWGQVSYKLEKKPISVTISLKNQFTNHMLHNELEENGILTKFIIKNYDFGSHFLDAFIYTHNFVRQLATKLELKHHFRICLESRTISILYRACYALRTWKYGQLRFVCWRVPATMKLE